MARRSDHTREELSALILEAATALVADEGRHAVTARAIAGRIGYSPGSIYNAVGDLQLVLLKVNAGTLDRLAQEMAQVIRRKEAGDPLEKVVAVAETYIRFVTTHHRLWSAVLEPVRTEGASPDWYGATRSEITQLVVEVLEPFYPQRSKRERAAVALWAALQGVAALSVADNLELGSRKFDANDIARSLVWRYLSGREEEGGKRNRPRR